MTLEFNKCCFSIELRTGCLIIAYLSLIRCIGEIVWSIFNLAAAAVFLAQCNDERVLVTFALVVTTIKLVFLILLLAFTIVLIIGLRQYKCGHVKAYLIYTLSFIVLFLIIFIADLTTVYNGLISASMIVVHLIFKLLQIYFLLVIRSYYLKMDDPANKPAVYNTA